MLALGMLVPLGTGAPTQASPASTVHGLLDACAPAAVARRLAVALMMARQLVDLFANSEIERAFECNSGLPAGRRRQQLMDS